MNILIKQARIIDSQSPFHGKVMDVLIEGGIIRSIKSKINNDKNIKTIEQEGL